MTNQCRTCCRPVDSPFRVYDKSGKVISGCVSKDHDGHLTPLSESLRWHNRPEGKALRRADKTCKLADVPAIALRWDMGKSLSAESQEYYKNLLYREGF